MVNFDTCMDQPRRENGKRIRINAFVSTAPIAGKAQDFRDTYHAAVAKESKEHCLAVATSVSWNSYTIIQ